VYIDQTQSVTYATLLPDVRLL